MSEGTYDIYVELDALLDTRLPVLSRISQQAGLQAFEDDGYYQRERDDFRKYGVSEDAWKEAWANRTADDVRRSQMTFIPHVMQDLVRKLELQERRSHRQAVKVVEVNVYPYRFPEHELLAIEQALLAYTGIMTPVKCVYIPLEELTPQLIKDRYGGCIMYNFRDWLAHHLQTFDSFIMPTVTILAPSLLHGEMPNMEELYGEGMKRSVGPFHLSEYVMCRWFALTHMDNHWFTILHPEMAPYAVRMINESSVFHTEAFE